MSITLRSLAAALAVALTMLAALRAGATETSELRFSTPSVSHSTAAPRTGTTPRTQVRPLSAVKPTPRSIAPSQSIENNGAWQPRFASPNVSARVSDGEVRPVAGETELPPTRVMSMPIGAPGSSYIHVPMARQAMQPSPAIDTAPSADANPLGVNCEQERAKLKPIGAITNNIAAEPGAFPPECGPTDDVYQARQFASLNYTWKASNLCHKPLYFEEVALERYGHAVRPVFQPAVSAAHFVGSTIIWPYTIGMDPPWECQYALGYYRPGSCAPWIIGGFPFSARGGATMALFATGTAIVIP